MTSAAALPPVRPDFAGAVAKVARAQVHIKAISDEAERYFKKRPYQVLQTPHPDTGQPGYALYERLPFPDRRFALLIGDAVHNLRAALDHIVTACAVAYGKPPNRTQFPIERDEKRFEAAIERQAADAGPLARDLLRTVRAWPVENPLLCALHELDIIDKHRLILAVACTMDIEIQVGAMNGLPVVTERAATDPPRSTSRFIPARPGYENAIAHDFSFTGDVIFPESEPLAGEPCVETLEKMVKMVADIIVSFEVGFNTIRLAQSLQIS